MASTRWWCLAICVAFTSPCADGLVRFAPGIEYVYSINGVQTIKDVTDIRLHAKVHISLEKILRDGQICRLKIGRYKIWVKSEGRERNVHLRGLNQTLSLLFEMSPAGEVNRVWREAAVDAGLVDIQKKLLASLSSKLLVSQQQMLGRQQWAYRVNETGTNGLHESLYTAKAGKNELLFTKERTRRTLESADESFLKEIVYSPTLHVVTRVREKGHFTAMARDFPGYKPRDGLGDHISQSKHYQDRPKVDVPVMHTEGDTIIRLVATTELTDTNNPEPNLSQLEEDTLEITQEYIPKVPLSEIRRQIRGNITCMVKAWDETEKATPCYRQTVELLMSLTNADLTALTREVMTRRKLVRQQQYVDALAALQTAHAQQLLVQYVLDAPEPVANLIMRVTLHFVDFPRPPAQELVDCIETHAFRKPYRFVDDLETQQVNDRIVLILGSVANQLKKWDLPRATQITRKIEDKLGVHDPYKHREKREALPEQEYHDMVQAHAIYLWALGNGAVESSYEHIVSYVNVSDTPMLWRRGAIHSLARYPTPQAAEHLLTLAVTDPDEDIRRAALLQYRKHPHGYDLVQLVQPDGSVHPNATAAVQHRMRRSLGRVLDKIWQGFRFNIKSPSIDWRKGTGGPMLGASLGLVIKNLLDITIKPLEGSALVDLHDAAWATIHVGALGYDINLLKAEICFKWHFAYELNILKEFGFNDLLDMADKFNKIVRKVYNALDKAVESFQNLLNAGRGINIHQMFDRLVNVIKELPNKVMNFPKLTKRILQVIDKYAPNELPASVHQLKQLIRRLQTLFRDVRKDVMDVYDTVVDQITVVLPWAGKEIVTAIGDLVQAIPRIAKNPKTAISDIGLCVRRVFTGIGGIIHVKETFSKLNFLKKENQPYWFNATGIVDGLMKELSDIKEQLKKDVEYLRQADNLTEFASRVTGINMNKMKADILEEIAEVIDEDLAGPLDEIDSIFGPVLDTYHYFMETVKNVKDAWEALKDGYETARTEIERLFGLKMSKAFPKKYLESEACGNGFFSSTGKNNYQHPGVDVVAQIGSEIVAPFEGTIERTGLRQVTIKLRRSLKMSVVIDNVDLYAHLDGKEVSDGQKIGTVTHSGWCRDGHVHFAMIKRGEDGGIVDPSRFMERRVMPPATCTMECAHYILEWKTVVISQNRLGQNPEPEDKTPDVAEPPNLSHLSLSTFSQDHEENSKRHEAYLSNMQDLRQLLNMTDFSDLFHLLNFRLDKVKFGTILTFLNNSGLGSVKQMILGVLDGIHSLVSSRRCVSVEEMDDNELRRELAIRGLPTEGPRETLVHRYLAPPDVCKSTVAHLSSTMQSCSFDSECQSFSCCVTLTYLTFKHNYLTSVGFDPCGGVVTLSIDDWSTEVNVSQKGFVSVEKSEPLDNDVNSAKVAGVTVMYKVERTDNVIKVSANVTYCSTQSERCLPQEQLVSDLPFQLTECSRGASPLPPIQDRVHMDMEKLKAMTLGEVVEYLENLDLDTLIINDVMTQLRSAVQQWILDNIHNLAYEIFGNEFALFDMCTKGHEVTLGEARTEFFNNPVISIPLGPILLHLRFGASGSFTTKLRCNLCIMSMKATASLTPELSAQLWGAVGAGLLALKGELRLTGYIFTTQFPAKAVVEFHKFPMEIRARLDLNLIPFKIELHALLIFEVKMDMGLFEIHIYQELIKTLLWDYSTPVVKKNIFNLNNAEPDKTPPTFTSFIKEPCTKCNRESLSQSVTNAIYPINLSSRYSNKCIVNQLAHRDYTDPAFSMDMDVSDDRSNVKLTFCVGTVPAGCNVVNNDPLAGTALLAKKLVSGVPLFFTVYATNSAGMRSSVTCSLPTYDTTLPGGRVTADFLRSSHPNVLKGSALVVDDSPIIDSRIAAGFGRGATGDQVISFTPISLNASQGGISGTDPALGMLKYFSGGVEGKLVASPFKISSYNIPQKCAQDCLGFPPVKCLAFNYDYGSDGRCELLEHVQGHGYEIHKFGRLHYFERLGIGHKASVLYRTLYLVHNNLYFLNFFVNNTLGYTSILSSPGILVDRTIPVPGHLESVKLDVTNREMCEDFIPEKYAQKCVDLTPINNFRYIVDGPESTTVGNGANHGSDLRYTRANRMIGAHWDGFHDDETGILVYTWSVGLEKCGDDIHPHKDPHHHLHHESQWTHTAVAFPLSLDDGNYHITLRALNKIDYGGPLAVTVCHSQPLTVDTTPPVLSNLTDVEYNQEGGVISLSYVAYDDLSGIMTSEFGLGRSKRDTLLLPYQEVENRSPMSFNYTIPDGVPAWVKLRVANHVELRSTAHADRPILVDQSPPIAGVVYDGPDHHRDLRYQASSTTICAAWKDFYDPESGIYRYMVGVGTGGQQDNVVAMEVVDAHTTARCWDRQLEHGRRYHTTVTAFHGGHDMLNVTAKSSGVLVDMTPPVAGTAKDGPADQPDVRFSSEAAVASVSWHGFHDPESGIQSYQVTFLRTHAGDTKEGIVHTDTISSDTSQLEVHHLHLHHGDRVRAVVMATNGAGSTCQASSSGFTVDLTAPNMHELSDGPTPGRNIHFTASLTTLSATWNYTDAESDVDKMKLAVYETRGGTSSRIHPTSTQWHELPGTSAGWTNERPFQLELGLHYHFQVAAVNGAGLTGVHQTDGVTVDNTPPEMLYVHAGAINSESEELDDGFVVHNEEEGIWGSWAGRDFESGIEKYLVALGTQPGGTDLFDFTDVGEKRSHYMTGFRFSLTNPDTNTPVYYISVKCVSGADQVSSVHSSSPIKVVEGDKTGVVYDGPNKAADVDFTLDGSTATVSFRGFQSARDGIASYLWTVGTLPYGDDVMAFTGYGIVRDMAEPDDASQQVHYGQVMLPLESGTTYYATVRALTGAGNVLESCSNGVTPDNSPPKAQFRQVGPEATEITDGVVYQTETDSLSASWNVTDPESGVTSVHVYHGSYPGEEMVSGKSKLYKAVDQIENSAMTPVTSGVANVLTLQASNKVGLDVTIVSPPVVVDQTPPEDGSLQCPVFISGAVELTCTWLGFGDAESGLGHYRIGMGRYQGDDSVAAYINVPLSRQHFTFPDVKSLNLTHEQTYYISVVAVNKVGLQSVGASVPVVVDDTPPEGGVVIEMSDSSAIGHTITKTGQPPTGLADKDAICQRSLTQLTAAFEAFVDRESGIDRYEIAVETSPGGAQIQDFTRISGGRHQITLTGLDMTHVTQAFVTVKGYNGAGHYSIATSNGVYISRISAGLEPLVASYVYDGTTRGKDLNYQDHNDGLSAHWDLRGDPCPVRSLRWAALRADKQYVVPFSPLQNDATEVAADELQLTDSKTYYVTIRVTNVLGYTYSLRSNGVTVQVEPLLPGIVRDGDITGVDLSFQPSLTTLSANWDRFGREYHVDNRG